LSVDSTTNQTVSPANTKPVEVVHKPEEEDDDSDEGGFGQKDDNAKSGQGSKENNS